MMPPLTVAMDLNAALRRCLRQDNRVYLLGEDLLDPYGGAFKVMKGLSTEFPDRVFPTPICEASIVGVAVGAALRGLLPVAEIMFGDFILLAADQLVNHAAKFAGMYNGQVHTPVVVRTPMGGGRGYGPTHSQTLEKHLLGVPGLRVVAVSHFVSPGSLLECAILVDPMPVLFIENKLLYTRPVWTPEGGNGLWVEVLAPPEGSLYPWACVRNYDPAGAQPDITVVTYGGMSWPLESALKQLAEEEIRVEAFLPAEISRAVWPEIEASCRVTGRLVVAEEGAGAFGWGASFMGILASRIGGEKPVRMLSVHAAESIIPSARGMEQDMLPSDRSIVQAILKGVGS